MSGGAARDLGEELVVGFGRLQFVDQEFQTGRLASFGGQTVQHTAQLPDLGQRLAAEEQLFVARRGGVHVDGRVDPALG
jgi:hypothetical protein